MDEMTIEEFRELLSELIDVSIEIGIHPKNPWDESRLDAVIEKIKASPWRIARNGDVVRRETRPATKEGEAR